MPLPLKIFTILSVNESKIKEKGSEFIAHAFPVETIEEATSTLNNIKKKYYDATHNCFAYKLADGSAKYSDGGEPSGTAGIRIMNAVNHFNLTNIIVIVTRYFGGTKLGVGPLGKAYYDSAYECLKQIKPAEKNLMERMSVKFEFEYANLVHRLLARYGCKIEGTKFENDSEIHFVIESSKKELFIKDLHSQSLNHIDAKATNEQFYF